MVIDNIDNIFPNLTRHGKLRIVSQLAYEVMMIALEKNGLQDVAFYAGDYIEAGLDKWVDDTLRNTNLNVSTDKFMGAKYNE